MLRSHISRLFPWGTLRDGTDLCKQISKTPLDTLLWGELWGGTHTPTHTRERATTSAGSLPPKIEEQTCSGSKAAVLCHGHIALPSEITLAGGRDVLRGVS